MALTTTTSSWPARFVAAICRATWAIFSASATDEPPYFWTTMATALRALPALGFLGQISGNSRQKRRSGHAGRGEAQHAKAADGPQLLGRGLPDQARDSRPLTAVDGIGQRRRWLAVAVEPSDARGFSELRIEQLGFRFGRSSRGTRPRRSAAFRRRALRRAPSCSRSPKTRRNVWPRSGETMMARPKSANATLSPAVASRGAAPRATARAEPASGMGAGGLRSRESSARSRPCASKTVALSRATAFALPGSSMRSKRSPPSNTSNNAPLPLNSRIRPSLSPRLPPKESAARVPGGTLYTSRKRLSCSA